MQANIFECQESQCRNYQQHDHQAFFISSIKILQPAISYETIIHTHSEPNDSIDHLDFCSIHIYIPTHPHKPSKKVHCIVVYVYILYTNGVPCLAPGDACPNTYPLSIPKLYSPASLSQRDNLI